MSEIGHLSCGRTVLENMFTTGYQRITLVAQILPMEKAEQANVNMDREIPSKEKRKMMMRRWVRTGGVVMGAIIIVCIVIRMAGNKVDLKSLELSAADVGDIQVTVTASGNVVPEYQEIIVSPINTRIVEIYKKTGDAVDEGTPLLRLDLQTAETDYKKGLDDEQMRRLQLQKLKITQNTQLTDIKLKIKVAQMALNSKQMELRNERYLDSIGSGTTDRVRQAELDYNTAQLELEQLKKQYENSIKAADAEYRVQQLDLEMYCKGLAEIKRTLDDANIRSPRKAVLTYINNSIGAQIQQGDQVAIVSDLSSFKAECSIADGYGNHLAVGGKVQIRTGNRQIGGTISNVNPQTKNGMMDFTVCFDDPSDKLLRPGLKMEVYVVTSEKRDVMRIRCGSFYKGLGAYDLFVKDGSRLVSRHVTLGEASYDYIEVTGGLKTGEEVVISDMEKYKGKSKININQ